MYDSLGTNDACRGSYTASVGRKWRLFQQSVNVAHAGILRHFIDDPSCAFSLHAVSKHASTRYGVHPGDWFGPEMISRVLRDLVNNSSAQTTDILVHVARGGLLECSAVKMLGKKKPVLIIVPTRLGLRTFDSGIYGNDVCRVLRSKYSVGIIGGRPRHSLYFVGSEGGSGNLIHLDPHEEQLAPTVTATFPTAAELRTFHCSRVRTMPVTRLDPSMAFGFFCRTVEEFDALCTDLSTPAPTKLFHIYPEEMQQGHRGLPSDGGEGGDMDGGDEWTLL